MCPEYYCTNFLAKRRFYFQNSFILDVNLKTTIFDLFHLIPEKRNYFFSISNISCIEHLWYSKLGQIVCKFGFMYHVLFLFLFFGNNNTKDSSYSKLTDGLSSTRYLVNMIRTDNRYKYLGVFQKVSKDT